MTELAGLAAGARSLGSQVLAWAGPMMVATAAILMVVWLADRALEKRVSASLRLFLYGAVLARLALPVDWRSPLGLLGFGGPAAGGVVGLEGDLTIVTLGPARAATTGLGAAGWAALVYAAVTLALAVHFVRARWSLRRKLQGCQPLSLPAAAAVPVVRHAELGPFVAGVVRPRIVLPARLVDARDDEALGWVLRHELAHVRRRDPMASTLVQLACILAWPILPVWIAARRIRALMEVACDEAAVSGADGSARRRYGEVLLQLAELGGPAGRLAPAVRFGSPLRGRLRALMARRRWPLAVQGAVIAGLVTVVVACAGEPTPEELAAESAATDADPTAALPRRSAKGLYGLKAPAPAPGEVLDVPSQMPRLLPERLRLEDPGSRPAAEPDRAGVMVPEMRVKSAAPAASFTPVQPPVLTITREGDFYLGRRKVPPENLEEEIRVELQRAGTDTLLLRGDKRVMLNTAVDVMAVAKRAAARNIGILAESAEQAAPAPATRTPRLGDAIPGQASVRGSLDKDVIRRVIRRHINEPKYCYERQLARNPELGGRIAVQFTIAATGDVVASVLQHTTMNDPRVESCVVQAVRGWKFPEPEGGGVVIVTYPFSFTPGEQAQEAKAAGVQGAELSPDAITGTIRGRMVEIKRCYERYLHEDPAPGGKLRVAFTIQRSGAVEGLRFSENQLQSASMAACIAKVFREMEFPENPGGPTEVDFPFVFQRSGP